MAASSLERLRSSSRRRMLPVLALVLLAALVGLAAAVYLYDRSQRDVIAAGVRVDGVPVGGLSTAAARGKVEHELAVSLGRPVTITSGGRSWTLDPARAHVHVDVNGMVAQALAASREGSILTRTFRGWFGGSLNKEVPLSVTYSHAAVRALAAEVRAGIDRAPRDATVEPRGAVLHTVPSQVGLAVDTAALGRRIETALTGSTRTVHVPVHHTQPAVTTAALAARTPAYIVINRSEFRLRFYDHLKLAKTYEIAVGMEGLETPAGLHKIEWEQVNPPWYVPNKAWAGALAGTVVPPGPADPLKARFMSFDGGAGIHGIDPSEYETIGHDASHGCVRMRIPDVIELYSKSPVGTPVYII
jgi:lipoprotein-anchoring transpeptidase ErfK/SrfK